MAYGIQWIPENLTISMQSRRFSAAHCAPQANSARTDRIYAIFAIWRKLLATHNGSENRVNFAEIDSIFEFIVYREHFCP